VPLPLFSRVRLATDEHEADGAPLGTIGSIIEVYEGGAAYEIEVSDADGRTLALFAAEPAALELVDPDESGR